MSEPSNNSSGGIGFTGLLTILFIGLKLTNHIDWPWIWVLSPLFAVVMAIVGVIWVIVEIGTWAGRSR